MKQAPGTVSKILWHFTGGPRWNDAESCQEEKRKPSAEAYHALLSILRSKEVRLGEYREVVKVRFPRYQRYNKQKRKMETVKNYTIQMRSSPVCCLSDIPVAHLSYHAERYGKLAIGFHRQAAVRHGFNPVFYALHDARTVRSVREGLVRLREIDADSIDSLADDVEKVRDEIENGEGDHGQSMAGDLGWTMRDLKEQAQTIGRAVESAQTSFREFLAFVKTFDRNDFSTIYCEREWRSTQKFAFTTDDLAMIVLPKQAKGTSYFERFIKRARSLKIPRSIPVVPWEDLVEH